MEDYDTSNELLEYELECHTCGHKWTSYDENENCPECNEKDNVGID